MSMDWYQPLSIPIVAKKKVIQTQFNFFVALVSFYGRGFSEAEKAYVEAESVIALLLVELDFESGFVRVNSTCQSIVYDGNTYLGTGQLGEVEPITDSAEIEAVGAKFKLSGVDPALISTTLNENYQGRSAKLWLALMDSEHQLLETTNLPLLLFKGRMDNMNIKLGKEGVIIVTAESRLAAWSRPVSSRFTNEEQQERFPGDKGLEYVSSIADKELFWGKS